MMILDNFIRIKAFMVKVIPNKGTSTVPTIMEPKEAPIRSAARHVAAGDHLSPMILVISGNCIPHKREKKKP